MSPDQFEDIRIVGLDESRSQRPDPTKMLYDVYLNLSATPPPAWQQIFEAERKVPRHSMWRRARVVGQYIVIHACLDEIEQYHLSDLKEDARNSNAKYREYLARQTAAEESRKARDQAERKALEDLKGRLAFDDQPSEEEDKPEGDDN